jgi:hypothetical protein
MRNSKGISPFVFSLSFLFLALFVCLYTIWIVPNTLSIKYLCLGLGSLLTLVYFFQQKNKVPITLANGLIGLFFIWVFAHYFLISSNLALSLNEIQSIQKRAILTYLFAIGLAIALRRESETKSAWFLFYVALGGPVFLFLLSQIFLPAYFHLSYTDSELVNTPYIPKYQYVFAVMFCIMWSLYVLKDSFIHKKGLMIFFISLTMVILSFFSFYKINGKNGMMYGAIAIVFFLGSISVHSVKLTLKQLCILALPFLIMGVLFVQHVQENPTWKYLTQDLSMGWQTEHYDNWKVRNGQNGVLQNPSGVNVSLSTYERAAWFKEGLKLIPDHPLGYRLIQDSFKYLAKDKWPESELFHTHSGWLDLTLGFGIPGFIFIFGAMLIAFLQCTKSQNYYAKSGTWVLPFMALAFLTSELCEKGSFELLIFVITFYGTISHPSHDAEFHSALKN